MKNSRVPALCAILLVFSAVTAAAQNGESSPGGPEISSRSAVVMDAATGTIVYYKNPDLEIPPASLTKLMTMHLAFTEIKKGSASLDESITPPRESWAVNQPPGSSLMYLAGGQKLKLRELFLGLSVCSGNDAAVAVALRFAPSVTAFADMMNSEAAALGLVKTRFTEPSGISGRNVTTAREFAAFCRFYLEAHPESLENYHSVPEFAYPTAEHTAGFFRSSLKTHVQKNRNNLLGKVEGVDGLKTGFIYESGYNIVLTAERNGSRFIAVILGAPADPGGEQLRDADGEKLLEWTFARYKTVRPAPGGLPLLRVWKGKTDHVSIQCNHALEFTAAASRGENLRWVIEAESLTAPLPKGSAAGNLVFYDDSGELRRVPLVTREDVEEGGFFKRLFDNARLFFRN